MAYSRKIKAGALIIAAGFVVSSLTDHENHTSSSGMTNGERFHLMKLQELNKTLGIRRTLIEQVNQ